MQSFKVFLLNKTTQPSLRSLLFCFLICQSSGVLQLLHIRVTTLQAI